MPMDIREWETLKREIANMEKAAAESTGRLQQLKEVLKKDFGCDSIKEARQLLRKLQKEELEHEKEFQKQFKRFLATYRGKLPS